MRGAGEGTPRGAERETSPRRAGAGCDDSDLEMATKI